MLVHAVLAANYPKPSRAVAAHPALGRDRLIERMRIAPRARLMHSRVWGMSDLKPAAHYEELGRFGH